MRKLMPLFLLAMLSVASALSLPAPVPIPHLNNQFYGHGAFFGASGQLLNDKVWSEVLKVLMPDVAGSVEKVLESGGGSKDVLLKFENNPIAGAYGIMKLKELDDEKAAGRCDRVQKMQAFEWDCWLGTAEVTQFKSTHAEPDSPVAYKLADGILIAHGNLIESIAENKLGLRQYNTVRKNDKTDQGGVQPADWTDLFYRAVELATANATHHAFLTAGYAKGTDKYFVRSTSKVGCELNTFQNKISYPYFSAFFKAKFGKQFRVLLDVKSRDATPEVLKALVYQFNQRHILVHAIGSFVFSENAGVDNMTQVIPETGQTFPGPIPTKFLHFNGDLQLACLKGIVKKGELVMFNGGSMIDYSSIATGDKAKASYNISKVMADQLRYYKNKYEFNLSIYVQENDIDEHAASMLVDFVNENPDIFTYGFAWGGIDGLTSSDIQPTIWSATVGTDTQSLIGTKWDTSIPLP